MEHLSIKKLQEGIEKFRFDRLSEAHFGLEHDGLIVLSAALDDAFKNEVQRGISFLAENFDDVVIVFFDGRKKKGFEKQGFKIISSQAIVDACLIGGKILNNEKALFAVKPKGAI